MDNLFAICRHLNFAPKVTMEFGAAHPYSSQVREFIAAGVPSILVEANPRLFYCLKDGWDMGDFQTTWPTVPPKPHSHLGFGHLPNVTLHHAAIAPQAGFAKFYERNASSFLEGVTSPAKTNDRYVEDLKDAYTVPTITTDMIDPGNVDLLAADVEGSEWFVLEKLVSRPVLICLETHGNNYVNPNLDKINAWMLINGYKQLGRTESDTVWTKGQP